MRLVIGLGCVLLASSVQAQNVYKCKGAAGQTLFQDHPCSGAPGQKLRTAPPPEAGTVIQYEEETPYLQTPAAPAKPAAPSGRDNMREYLDQVNRDKAAARAAQRAQLDEAIGTSDGIRAENELDEAIRSNRNRQNSALTNSYERERLMREETRLQRRKSALQTGVPEPTEINVEVQHFYDKGRYCHRRGGDTWCD